MILGAVVDRGGRRTTGDDGEIVFSAAGGAEGCVGGGAWWGGVEGDRGGAGPYAVVRVGGALGAALRGTREG